MRTVIIGGGKGGQAILGLARSAFLKEMAMDVQCVMDIDPDAPGMVYARKHGLKTTVDMEEALALPHIDLVIELTGNDAILNAIHHLLPPGAKLIDHTFAHVFWDLVNAQEAQRRQLEEKTVLERRIQAERLYIQSLFDSIPDMVIVFDRDQRIIRTNARFEEVTGITHQEACGKKCHEVFQSTDLAIDCHDTCVVHEVFETGETATLIHQTPPPREIYWEVTQTPIKDKHGEVEVVIETWHRITEKVMLRREIEHVEARFMRFIESANDLISIKDLEGRYMVVNKKTADSFGLKVEDFIGKKVEQILPGYVSSTVSRHDLETIRTKQPQSYEEVFQINGRDRYFSTLRFPLTDYTGGITGVCTIARDITRRLQLQEQLVQSAKLVAMGQLAAGVAHEINNPLTGILAFSEDVRDDLDKDNPHYEDMQVIIRETLRCREIVRNLLDFSRQDAPSFENINPNDVVDRSMPMVSKHPRFKDVSIQINKADDLPLIQADPNQLQQVVLNLMMNSAEAMKGKGKIILNTEYDRRHDKCIIAVEDTGPGIPENLIDKVFEPFFSSKGTSGLGLALSWGIVERHRGVIEVDTAETGGAIFRILLPALTEP